MTIALALHFGALGASGIIGLLISILVFALIVLVVLWVLGLCGVPEPIRRVVGAILALILLLSLLAGCALDPGDTHQKRAGRVTVAVLQNAAELAGRVAIATLKNAFEDGQNGQKVDLMHSATEGLWQESATIVSAKDVQRVVNAWGGGKLDTVAAASAAAYRAANPQTEADRKAVVSAIAGSLSAAAFDATGMP
jgi:hypothetical protein